MKKLIIDGQVAIILSGGYGAGWYTWNHRYPEMLFDPEIAKILLDSSLSREKQVGDIINIAKRKYPDAYLGGVEDLTVVFLPEGTKFAVTEYDGSEQIIFSDLIA